MQEEKSVTKKMTYKEERNSNEAYIAKVQTVILGKNDVDMVI